jgi:hypothetical protein
MLTLDTLLSLWMCKHVILQPVLTHHLLTAYLTSSLPITYIEIRLLVEKGPI